MRAAVLAVLLASGAALAAAERWDLQYFYDEKDSSLEIRDLKFPSLKRGVAVGMITEGNRTRPVTLVTSDGGTSWSISKTREAGRSLFFLNDSLGWMVTDRALWKTVESGRSWTKLPESSATRGLVQVWFVDEKRGWAVGQGKAAYVTSDGGRSWAPVPEAGKVNSDKRYTTFGEVAFADQLSGVIVGRSAQPRPSPLSRLPAWMQPEVADRMREVPHLMVLLSTSDGGKTWRPATSSVFGEVTRIVLHPNGEALALLRYAGSFQYSSEVHFFDWKTGQMAGSLRRADRAVTDVAFSPIGTAYLAAIEHSGRLKWSPIPAKLSVMKSTDHREWTEMQVDYRGIGTRAILAVADDSHAWMATDTGMILRLVQE